MFTVQGPHAIGVPGEIAGYWEAKLRYGNKSISWGRLVQPTVSMCREGITVTETLATALAAKQSFTDPGMSQVFINNQTGQVWRQGDKYKNTKLADTLEALAQAGDEGADLFYKGEIADKIVDDLKSVGGNITKEDLEQYSSEWMVPVNTSLMNNTIMMFSVPPPASGVVLAAILNIINTFNTTLMDTMFYQRIVESFKWAYGVRSNLGDPYDEDISDFIK